MLLVYLVPLFGLQVAVYSALLLAVWMSTKRLERTAAFRILVFSMCFFCVGAAVRFFGVFFFDRISIFGGSEHSELAGSILSAGTSLFSIGVALKPLFFRALRQPVSKALIFSVLAAWLAIIIFQRTFIADFGLGPASGINTAIFMLLVGAWSLFELNKTQDFGGPALKLLKATAVLLIIFHIYLLAYCVIYFPEFNIRTAPMQSVAYAHVDFWVRSIRIALFCVVDALCVFFWLQGYSSHAILAATSRKKIEMALIEKELLVKNLINANALIQTGAVTAGLSHEINQFLARIQLDVESAKVQLENNGVDNVVPILNRVLSANSGASLLVQNMKKLFVKHDEELTLCDVDSLIQSVVQIYVARTKLSKIALTVDLQSKAQVFIRETLIRQVVSNLIVNAIDALDLVNRQDKKITVVTSIEGDRWILRVQDNADGVRPENAHKIFSLFSTSKSQGSGIGLWLSRHIVEQHSGYLRFVNIEPQGVQFWLEMPIRPILGKDSSNTLNLLLS